MRQRGGDTQRLLQLSKPAYGAYFAGLSSGEAAAHPAAAVLDVDADLRRVGDVAQSRLLRRDVHLQANPGTCFESRPKTLELIPSRAAARFKNPACHSDVNVCIH